jgi:hypothetical protein
MAAAAYTTDLTDIYTDTGNFSLISSGGGGANSLTQPETDDYIQGVSAVSRNPWSASIRGMVDDNAAAITVAAGNAIFIWTKADVAQALNTKALGGIQCLIGSGVGDLSTYYVDGSNTYAFGGWKSYPIDPRTGTVTRSGVLGTPNGTIQFIGVRWDVPASGPSKGFPFKVDSIRHGRTLTITDGDLANGYATFQAAADFQGALTRQWGLFQEQNGSFLQQGLFQLGTGATSVDFRDSNAAINIAATDFVAAPFNAFEVNNASSNVEFTGVSITALGTVSRGTFTINNNAVVAINTCTFSDMSTFSLGGTNTTITNTAFNRCNAVTLNGSALTNCTFNNSTAVSSVIATDLGDLDGCTFISDGSNHAVELTAVGTGSMNWNGTATGYETGVSGNNVTSTSTGNETIYLNFTSAATFTVNVASGATTPSIRKGAGMTGNVNIIAGAVSITVTAVETNGTPVQNARVFVQTNTGSGTLPYQDSISITRSGTTATATHTAHGLANGDKVVIRGADQNAYVSIHTISNVTTNTYDFTVSGSPTTPATGTIISSFVFISGTTDINGEITSPARTLGTNQSISGNVRKASTSPYYKTGQVVGTINTANGLNSTVVMLRDE